MTDPLRLDQQLCFPLYAASNLLTRRYRPLLEALGLTYPQYLVMLVLWEDAPRTVGELGRLLYLDSGTLTPLLKRLAAQGLIARQRAEEDERRVMISLTKAGWALKQRAASVPEAMLCQLSMTPTEFTALRAQLQALLATLASPPG
ncbi:MAG: MarR family winged helix-turn-helix transcriptional regulator [Microvirgula sp.]